MLLLFYAAVLLAAPAKGLLAAPAELVAAVDEGPNTVRLRAVNAPVHVPVCRGVAWEQFDEEKAGFIPIPGPPCGPDQPAIKVDVNGVLFTFDASHQSEAVEYRVIRPVAVVGIGCVEGRPFTLAQCKELVVIQGPNIGSRRK